jgi:hypothetical protein
LLKGGVPVMSTQKKLIGLLGLAAAGVALGALAASWWSRRAVSAAPSAQVAARRDLDAESAARALDDALHDLPPDSTVFEPAPVSDRHITARPSAHASQWQSADDYDAISPDELGSAFLARALAERVGCAGDDDEILDERSGFRIVQRD